MNMKPHEIYNAIEDVWKLSAVHTMALDLIASGKQQPNPAAYTYPMQHKAWDRVTTQMRTILDELERLGKGSKASPLAPLGEVGGPEVPPVAPRLDPACGFCCEQEDVGEDGACRCACHASTPDLEYRAALRVCVEALKQIRLRIAVWEGGDQKALESGLKALEAPKPEAPARKLEWGLSERQDAINILRQVCADHGDNDWPDDLHLGDVIEKHLWRNLAAPEASPVVDPAPLAWTKEKPARDGWYWYRVPGQSKQSIDLVQLFTGSPCWHSAERMAWVPITWDLEWAGPIAEPVEAPAPLVKGGQP